MQTFSPQLQLFLSTFALIFVAELPDKTALATVFLATRHRPRAVFLGVALAFAVQSAVAVTFGSLLSFLPRSVIHLAAGALFVIFAVLMWRGSEGEEKVTDQGTLGRTSFFRAAWMSFVVIFAAEWGDFTQLATAALAAEKGHPWIVLTSATLALWSVTALAILVGTRLKGRVPARLLERLAAVLFAVVGIVIIVEAFLHR